MEIDREEISFDQLIPFLFPINDKGVSRKLSNELRIYRAIVDNLNKGQAPMWIRSISDDISIPIIDLESYNTLNNHNRFFNSSILNSYLKSTKRVFYRFLLLRKYRSIFHPISRYQIYYLCKFLSAFLLFDDDIFDLEEDIRNGKKTILTEYLDSSNFNIQDGIEEMTGTLKQAALTSDFSIFNNYVEQFLAIYHE